MRTDLTALTTDPSAGPALLFTVLARAWANGDLDADDARDIFDEAVTAGRTRMRN